MKEFLKGSGIIMIGICILSLLNALGAIIDIDDKFGPETIYGSIIIAIVSGISGITIFYIAIKKYTS